MSTLPTIAAFWTGPYLSWLEQLGLSSFVAHGHRMILYMRGEVLNVPAGVEMRAASEIWDDLRVAGYRRDKQIVQHPAALLSDFFRWNLQKKTNYFYMDVDFLCIKPINLWTEEELAQRGFCFQAMFIRYPQKSPAIDYMVKFLSHPYSVPPWFPRRERLRLWRQKMKGRAVSIELMPWGSAGMHLQNWAHNKFGGKPPNVKGFVINAPQFPCAFLEAKNFEFIRSKDAHVMMMNWPVIYKWRPDLLDAPPADSWIAQKAAELGVVPEDAPVLETRAKNREAIAAFHRDSRFLM